jgi:cellulose synthase/poly-beta-1,6-N-acetylglucosamine synthase-like glycosyltransferase
LSPTVYWVWGLLVGGAWFCKLVDCALGMPKVPDIARPEWQPDASATAPKVTVVVPALNEEEKLEAALHSLLALDY